MCPIFLKKSLLFGKKYKLVIYSFYALFTRENCLRNTSQTSRKRHLFLALLSQVMWHTGRRIGEVLGVTFSSLEEKDKEVLVHFPKEKVKQSKNRFRKTLAVAVPSLVWQEWMQLLKPLGAPSCRIYVFSLKKGTSEKYPTLLARYLRKITLICQENPHLHLYLLQQHNNRFHIWRHSYAYALRWHENFSLDELQEALGHESINTTKEYYGDWYFDPARRFFKHQIFD